MIYVNGEPVAADGKTVAGFVSDSGYDPQRIAVEKNGLIVPKRLYNETYLEDGDHIEVVSFVGGG